MAQKFRLVKVVKNCKFLTTQYKALGVFLTHVIWIKKFLPFSITFTARTNAERLCSALIHQADRYRSLKGAISFRVYHKCFGKCEGICTPDLFSLSNPSCIECQECHGLFSPQKFVCHVHNSQENRTCHWGFDSGNWRAYIQIALDENNREKYSKMLDDIREQEIQESIHILSLQREREMCHPKRKVSVLLSLFYF